MGLLRIRYLRSDVRCALAIDVWLLVLRNYALFLMADVWRYRTREAGLLRRDRRGWVGMFRCMCVPCSACEKNAERAVRLVGESEDQYTRRS